MKSTRIAVLVLVLALTVPAASGGVVVTGSGGPVPPGGMQPGTFLSEVTVGAGFSIFDVQVTLNILYHTWAADLVATLIHVDTLTSATLVNRIGGPNDYDGTYTFSDAAGSTPPIMTFPIPSGTWLPHTPLAAFDGESSAGTWRLEIEDVADGDFGSLDSWTLTLASPPAPPGAPIPEPSTLALFGLGAVLLARARRRR